MRKFYSIIVVAIMSLISLSVQAKQISLVAAEGCSGLITIVDDSNDINITLTETPQEVETPEYGNAIAKAADGYVVGTVAATMASGYSGYTTDRSTYKEVEFYMNWGMFSDGDVVTISVVDPATVKSKEVNFVGAPDSYYVKYSDYYELTPDENGQISNVDYSYIYSLNVFPADGYRLKSVVDQNGNSYFDGSADYAYISTYSFPEPEMTFTVTTEDLSTVEGNRFTLNIVDGYPYQVTLLKGYSTVNLNGNKQTQSILFEDGDEFSIGSYSSNSPLYKVLLNDAPVEKNEYGYYHFIPADGDVVDVYTQFPAVPIPFKVTFTGTADASIVKYASYSDDSGYYNAEQILADGFSPILGKQLYMSLNTDAFDNVSVKINGVTQTDNSSIQLVFTDEDGYDIEIYGERGEPYHVTIVTALPEALTVYKGYSGQTYTLTGNVTEIVVDRSETNLKFEVAEGYRLMSMTIDGNSYSNDYYQVTSDCEIEVEIEKINRDRTMAIYVDESANLNSWCYFQISMNDYTLRKQWNVTPGYTLVEFGDFDLPIYASLTQVDTYATPIIYVNDQLAELNSGMLENTEDLADGSTIKIYGEEQTPCEVVYTISANANVDVKHDHISAIESPSVHSVLPGTIVHIVPVSEPAAQDDEEMFVHTVKVNGENLEANEDGVFETTVKADTQIEVTYGNSSGISAIEADEEATDAAIYNLQGIRVSGDKLPAGVYIRDGKKFIVK